MKAQTGIQQGIPGTVRIGLPLPDRADSGSKTVREGDGERNGRQACIPFGHRRSIVSHDRPAIMPVHRLQMRDSAVGTDVLEVDKPVSSFSVVNPSSLMRAVDRGCAL